VRDCPEQPDATPSDHCGYARTGTRHVTLTAPPRHSDHCDTHSAALSARPVTDIEQNTTYNNVRRTNMQFALGKKTAASFI